MIGCRNARKVDPPKTPTFASCFLTFSNFQPTYESYFLTFTDFWPTYKSSFLTFSSFGPTYESCFSQLTGSGESSFWTAYGELTSFFQLLPNLRKLTGASFLNFPSLRATCERYLRNSGPTCGQLFLQEHGHDQMLKKHLPKCN